MANSITIRTTAPGAKQVTNEMKVMKGAIGGLGSKTGGPLGTMLGGLAGINPLALAAGAGIGAMSGFLIDGVASAIAEEKSLGRLDQALENNVKNWDGDRDAMDRAVESAQTLAFEDDALRDSLVKLVTATGNEEEAIKDMNLAMDIARGRNIDLGAATDIVVKANMGNVGALRRLGIEVEKGSTKFEILAELQKRYGDQAAEYADTTEGKMQAARIAIDELAEDFGSVLVPALGDAAKATTDFFTNFARQRAALETQKTDYLAGAPTEGEVRDALQRLQDLAKGYQFGDALDPKTYLYTFDIEGTKTALQKQISDLQMYLNTLVDPRDESALGLRLAEQITNSAAQGLAEQAPKVFGPEWMDEVKANGLAAIAGVVDATEPEWHRLAVLADEAAQDSVGNLADTLRKGKTFAADAMDDLVFAMNHPLMRAKQIAQIEGALTSAKLAEGLSSNDEAISGAAEAIRNDLIDQWEKLTGRSYEEGVAAGNAYARGVRDAKVPVFRSIAGAGRVAGEHVGGGGRAKGGPVREGEAYVVGEQGREVFVPERNGTIIPHGPTMAGGLGPSRIDVHVNLSVRDFAQHQRHYAVVSGGPAFR